MKTFVKNFMVFLFLLVCSTGYSITVDGNWNDWFVYNGNSQFSNWNETRVVLNNNFIRTLNDEEGPTPGGGGNLYDIEQIFYYYNDFDVNNLTGGKLFIGLVTGFSPNGNLNDNLFAGDMFIDIGSTGTYTFALNTSTNINDSSRFNQIWLNSNWNTISTTSFSESNPYRVNEYSNGAINITNILMPEINIQRHGVHYFYEMSICLDGSLEESLTNESGGLGLHWTMECGNDNITVFDDVPLEPVPEPSTLILLGIGLSSAFLKNKFIC